MTPRHDAGWVRIVTILYVALKEGTMQKFVAVVAVVLLYILAYVGGSTIVLDFQGVEEYGVMEVWQADPFLSALTVVAAIVFYLVVEED